MRLLAFITILLFMQIEAKSQARVAKINITKGAHVDFNFNTFTEFKNGLQLIGYTEFTIYFKDIKGNDSFTVYHGGWQLQFTPNPLIDLTTFFSLTGPPLNIIEYEIIQTSTSGENFVGGGGKFLDGITTEIANQRWVGLDGDTFVSQSTYRINYYCNKGKYAGSFVDKLGKYVNDTYFVELNFSLFDVP